MVCPGAGESLDPAVEILAQYPVISMETQAAIRLAVMLQPTAPRASSDIQPPVRQMAAVSPAGTSSSMISASRRGGGSAPGPLR